ncbi:MAG: TIGR02300 family protein [Rhodospirillales bacterium]|nr:TIGR02300 family protein [Rhodospirillales bacterium]
MTKPMARPDWGTKHSCQNCGAKYYDLNRSPIVCPKCGTEFNPDALLRSRRSRPSAPAPAKEPAPKVETKKALKDDEEDLIEDEDEELAALEDSDGDLPDVDDGEDDDEPIEDPSELGEDDDDMAEVVIGDDDKDDT